MDQLTFPAYQLGEMAEDLTRLPNKPCAQKMSSGKYHPVRLKVAIQSSMSMATGKHEHTEFIII